MKNKNGFISMTLVYTFLILFLFVMLAILKTYSRNNKVLTTFSERINNDLRTSNEQKSKLYYRRDKDYYMIRISDKPSVKALIEKAAK